MVRFIGISPSNPSDIQRWNQNTQAVLLLREARGPQSFHFVGSDSSQSTQVTLNNNQSIYLNACGASATSCFPSRASIFNTPGDRVLSLRQGDINHDGIPDVVVNFAHRGMRLYLSQNETMGHTNLYSEILGQGLNFSIPSSSVATPTYIPDRLLDANPRFPQLRISNPFEDMFRGLVESVQSLNNRYDNLGFGLRQYRYADAGIQDSWDPAFRPKALPPMDSTILAFFDNLNSISFEHPPSKRRILPPPRRSEPASGSIHFREQRLSAAQSQAWIRQARSLGSFESDSVARLLQAPGRLTSTFVRVNSSETNNLRLIACRPQGSANCLDALEQRGQNFRLGHHAVAGVYERDANGDGVPDLLVRMAEGGSRLYLSQRERTASTPRINPEMIRELIRQIQSMREIRIEDRDSIPSMLFLHSTPPFPGYRRYFNTLPPPSFRNYEPLPNDLEFEEEASPGFIDQALDRYNRSDIAQMPPRDLAIGAAVVLGVPAFPLHDRIFRAMTGRGLIESARNLFP